MPDPFISREDLADHRRRGEDLSGDKAALAAIDAACEVCRTEAEQIFNAVTEDEIRLDGSGLDSILLPELPVGSIHEVWLDGGSLLADEDYFANGNGVLFRGSVGHAISWRKGRQNVRVIYDHGFEPEDLPRDVRMTALVLAARLYEQGDGLYETLGQASVRYAGEPLDLSPGQKRILRKYRRAK